MDPLGSLCWRQVDYRNGISILGFFVWEFVIRLGTTNDAESFFSLSFKSYSIIFIYIVWHPY